MTRAAAMRPMDAAAARGIVALQRCAACGRVQYPPRELCGVCLSDALEWQESESVEADLLAATVLHHSHDPVFARGAAAARGSGAAGSGPGRGRIPRCAVRARNAGARCRAGRPRRTCGAARDGRAMTDRAAIVTGGSAGIGRAICETLLADGCHDRVARPQVAGRSRIRTCTPGSSILPTRRRRAALLRGPRRPIGRPRLSTMRGRCGRRCCPT